MCSASARPPAKSFQLCMTSTSMPKIKKRKKGITKEPDKNSGGEINVWSQHQESWVGPEGGVKERGEKEWETYLIYQECKGLSLKRHCSAAASRVEIKLLKDCSAETYSHCRELSLKVESIVTLLHRALAKKTSVKQKSSDASFRFYAFFISFRCVWLGDDMRESLLEFL